MTIQRQYSLPNCTLVLEGFGDASAKPGELRPVMSILTNAECRLISQPVMRGGKDFFEGLIATVSRYAQEVLSGIHVPVADADQQAVHIERLSSDQHQLTFAPATGAKQVLTLNTVQLFDLVEAIDQFIADTQTLPQWSLGLKPASKRFAPREPLTKQAVPFAAGLGSLAIAAAVFAALPTPEIKTPNDLTFSPSPPTAVKPEAPAGDGKPVEVGSSTPKTERTDKADADKTTSTAAEPSTETPKITDPEQLAQLGNQLETQLKTNFDPTARLAETVSYQVVLGQDGKILDYRPDNAAATDLVNQTPLPKLRYNPVPGSDSTAEPVATFRAEFTPEGAVRVIPWREPTQTDQSGQPKAAPATSLENKTEANTAATGTDQEIRQRAALVDLQAQLYDRIDQSWQAPNGVTFDQPLTFSVRTDATGKIIDYAPYNQSAIDYQAETPLPSLGQEGNSDRRPDGAFARFKVVFNPNGRLEVNPWDGYPEEKQPQP
jgi:hypothetical protein